MPLAEVGFLERAIGKITVKDRSLRDSLDGIKKGLADDNLEESITGFWRLIYANPTHDIVPAELNALEKLLSFGLVTSETAILPPASEDGSSVVVNEAQMVLHESLVLAQRLSGRPEMELECIKIFLTSCTTPKCMINWADVELSLDALLSMVARTRNLVNRSAAKGALTQIVNEKLLHSEHQNMIFEWLGRQKPATPELAVVLLDIWVVAKGGWSDNLDVLAAALLQSCTFVDKAVFSALLGVLSALMKCEQAGPAKEIIELTMNRLLYPRYFCGEKNSSLWPLDIQANKEQLLKFINKELLDDPQLVMNLYLNVDCTAEWDPVIERLFHVLETFINPQVLEKAQSEFRLNAFATLMQLCKSLLKWAKPADSQAVVACSRRREAVSLFNKKPRSAIEFAVKNKLIGADDESKGRFLRYTRGLNKALIGDLLSEPESGDLLTAFVGLESFSGLSFVTGLRKLLQLFRLPGEAQKIDRIIDAFSKRYCQTSGNVELRGNPTLVFQMSFMAVMLNTDLHSPQVKDKMGFGAFVENCRGLDGGEDIPEGLLRDLYDDIAGGEFELSEDYIMSPLPLNSRRRPMDGKWEEAIGSGLVLELFKGAEAAINRSAAAMLSDDARVAECLEVYDDLLGLMLDAGDLEVAERFLWTILSVRGGPWIKWLYSFIDRHANKLGLLWSPILSTLADFEIATLVDDHHNIQTIDLGRLEGPGLLCFIQSLLLVPPECAFYEDFLRHYSGKLEALPSLGYERIAKASYTGNGEGMGIFALLSQAFRNPCLRQSSFVMLNKICQEQMPLLSLGHEKALTEFTHALILFGLDGDPAIADPAIGMFRFVADLLFSAHLKSGHVQVEREEFALRWNPIISGLTHVAIHQDNIVLCGNAIKIVYEIIKQQGLAYGPEQWKKVFRTVFAPTLEDLSLQRGRLATELIVTSLNWIIGIVSAYAAQVLSEEVGALDLVLGWVEGMLERSNEHLSKSSLMAFNSLVSQNALIFSQGNWDTVLEYLASFNEITLPTELLDFADESLRFDLPVDMRRGSQESAIQQSPGSSTASLFRPDFHTARNKGALQLLLLHSVKDMLLNGIMASGRLSTEQLNRILGVAERSASFASAFNSNVTLRTSLWKAGFLDSFENILLSKQEAAAIQLSLAVLFKAHQMDALPAAGDRLQEICEAILGLYLDLLEDDPTVAHLKRSLKSWPVVVCQVFEGLRETGTELPWIGEILEPALRIYRLDKTEVTGEAHRFLLALYRQRSSQV